MDAKYFLTMIRRLRHNEEIVLYGNVAHIPNTELAEARAFLIGEYRDESLEYPYAAPECDEQAALWGAMTIYAAAQLLLYRENTADELPKLLQPFNGRITPSAILSADMCLRFLPDILNNFKHIDPEDSAIKILETILHQWHYSGIAYELAVDAVDFDPIAADRCVLQLYSDRVIHCNNLRLAQYPKLHACIAASLGAHTNKLWNDFTTVTIRNEQQ